MRNKRVCTAKRGNGVMQRKKCGGTVKKSNGSWATQRNPPPCGLAKHTASRSGPAPARAGREQAARQDLGATLPMLSAGGGGAQQELEKHRIKRKKKIKFGLWHVAVTKIPKMMMSVIFVICLQENKKKCNK